ncbi:hypothetical protein BGW36DRAFT_412306 [Talaromyces proteolyticus]|uniref:Uncharacterized protein n=1 Tax=Talaromyces proteolyticus TaxID=1131652 RepID=A0AAD4KDX0_9EURO|nr:uncharacterized protein BGW36DRAFT_412306 [Talaromyces proteolyticus]KAH8689524.1 hypothetical protein BGW36DRAFT_412306 [Talaromyces proteolyticus]
MYNYDLHRKLTYLRAGMRKLEVKKQQQQDSLGIFQNIFLSQSFKSAYKSDRSHGNFQRALNEKHLPNTAFYVIITPSTLLSEEDHCLGAKFERIYTWPVKAAIKPNPAETFEILCLILGFHSRDMILSTFIPTVMKELYSRRQGVAELSENDLEDENGSQPRSSSVKRPFFIPPNEGRRNDRRRSKSQNPAQEEDSRFREESPKYRGSVGVMKECWKSTGLPKDLMDQYGRDLLGTESENPQRQRRNHPASRPSDRPRLTTEHKEVSETKRAESRRSREPITIRVPMETAEYATWREFPPRREEKRRTSTETRKPITTKGPVERIGTEATREYQVRREQKQRISLGMTEDPQTRFYESREIYRPDYNRGARHRFGTCETEREPNELRDKVEDRPGKGGVRDCLNPLGAYRPYEVPVDPRVPQDEDGAQLPDRRLPRNPFQIYGSPKSRIRPDIQTGLQTLILNHMNLSPPEPLHPQNSNSDHRQRFRSYLLHPDPPSSRSTSMDVLFYEPSSSESANTSESHRFPSPPSARPQPRRRAQSVKFSPPEDEPSSESTSSASSFNSVHSYVRSRPPNSPMPDATTQFFTSPPPPYRPSDPSSESEVAGHSKPALPKREKTSGCFPSSTSLTSLSPTKPSSSTYSYVRSRPAENTETPRTPWPVCPLQSTRRSEHPKRTDPSGAKPKSTG